MAIEFDSDTTSQYLKDLEGQRYNFVLRVATDLEAAKEDGFFPNTFSGNQKLLKSAAPYFSPEEQALLKSITDMPAKFSKETLETIDDFLNNLTKFIE